MFELRNAKGEGIVAERQLPGTNNLNLKLPGGALQQQFKEYVASGADLDEEDKKFVGLLEDVERLCGKLDIDTKRVHKLHKESYAMVIQGNREGAFERKREIDEILNPLFRELMVLGYSEHEIWG